MRTSKLRLFAPLLILITVFAGAEEKRADEMPVLMAKSIAVTPAHPEPEEPAVVVLTIENSNAPAEDVEVVFYANGEMLASRLVNTNTGTTTVSVPWMAKSVGKTTLVGVVDPRQLLVEGDRYDNTYALDVVTSVRPAVEADFAVTGVDVLAPADSPGRIRVDVANEGTVSASAPLVIRRNGEAVAVVDTGVLEAGKGAAIEVPWSDPDRGKISAEVNPRWASDEPSSKNNTLAASAASVGVDLRIEHLAFHTLQYEEDRTRRIGINFRIVNDGAQSVTKPFRTRIDPGAVDKDGKLVPAYVSTDALPAGGTVYVSHIFESAPGEFALTADADIDNAVAEADEKNNAAAKEFHNPAPDPDRWVNIGPRRVIDTTEWYGWSAATGRLSTMAIDPTAPSTMYVGAQLSGVWKTTDGGANWVSLADSATVRVAALALEPGNPSRVFLVTPSDGVLRSDDGGTSWTQISSRDLAAVIHAGSALLINPSAPNQMVVSSDRGVFRSTDGGVTWTDMPTLSGGECKNLVHRPHNGALYATLFHKTAASPAGVYESFNWGLNWRLVRGCPSEPLPSADANTLIRYATSGLKEYIGYKLADTFRLFRPGTLGCNIGGESDSEWVCVWNPDSDPAKHIWSGLWANPANSNHVFATGTYVYRSTNSGSDFSTVSGLRASGSAHSDHHQMVFDPTVPSTVYTLTDGGIYRSTNGGGSGSWVFIGDGITNVEFYDGAVAPTDANIIIGGTQDNGTVKGTAGNAVWSEIDGGDGATVDVDPTNSSILYEMGQYADSIQRSTDGGDDFSPAHNGLPTEGKCQNLHWQVHPNRPATLVASCMFVWRTTNSGASWSAIFTPLTNTMVRTAIDGPADIYYAGSSSGEIFRAPGGQSWSTIFEHPNEFPLTDLEIDLANPSRLYASFEVRGPVQSGRIVRLVRNAATGNFTAYDLTGDLPMNRIVRTIAIDPNRALTLYAGTERGVFQGRSTDHGVTWFWRPYNNGMSLADVRDLEVHPTTGIMRAFTHGRSAFEVTTSRATGGGEEVAAAGQGKKSPSFHDGRSGALATESPVRK